MTFSRLRQWGRTARIIGMGVLFLMLCFVLSLTLGRYVILLPDLLDILLHRSADDVGRVVLWEIRLPRLLLAIITGAALSCGGTVFQATFRNPMASPDILGVAAGCSLGAAAAMMLPRYIPYQIQVFSFVGGIAAMAMVYAMASMAKGQSVVNLILSGMIISALFNAALSFLKYIADPYSQLQEIVFWTMGGLHRANWTVLIPLMCVAVPCILVIMLSGWQLNILTQGDEQAESMGVNVRLLRNVLITVVTLLLALCISICGTIGWVGLVIPHITRMLVGHDHRLVLPMSGLLGAGFFTTY